MSALEHHMKNFVLPFLTFLQQSQKVSSPSTTTTSQIRRTYKQVWSVKVICQTRLYMPNGHMPKAAKDDSYYSETEALEFEKEECLGSIV